MTCLSKQKKQNINNQIKQRIFEIEHPITQKKYRFKIDTIPGDDTRYNGEQMMNMMLELSKLGISCC
jgi:spore coat protein CotF